MSNPFKFAQRKIENFVDKYTMYQVMVTSLLAIVVSAFVLSFLNIVSISPVEMFTSFLLILISGIATHYICIKIWVAPDNLQSSVISLLILFLIISPSTSVENINFIVCCAVATILSKYILVLHGRHIFNPVAVAIFIAGIFGYLGAEWWVGSRYLLPIVIVSGLFVILKLRKLPLVTYFIFISSIISIIYFQSLENLTLHLLSYPTIFLAIYMLTEPNAFPGSKKQEYIYATIIAFFFSIPINIGNFIHGTPELAILIGNIYSTFKENKAKYFLTLKEKNVVAKNTIEYIFESDKPVPFVEGQYLEWTLPHPNPDARGIKRTFTISASNSADKNTKQISFAVKHLPTLDGKQIQSTFKQNLEKLEIGSKIFASLLAGNFVLPSENDAVKQNVYFAGGIGITPFISFLRKKIQDNQKIDDVLFYSVNTQDDLAFINVLEEAEKNGLKFVPIFTKEMGSLSLERIKQELNNNLENKIFYISGPSAYVENYKNILLGAGIKNKNIITDYFSGLG